MKTGPQLKVSLGRQEKPGIEPGTPGYNGSGLSSSTAPWWLLFSYKHALVITTLYKLLISSHSSCAFSPLIYGFIVWVINSVDPDQLASELIWLYAVFNMGCHFLNYVHSGLIRWNMLDMLFIKACFSVIYKMLHLALSNKMHFSSDLQCDCLRLFVNPN